MRFQALASSVLLIALLSPIASGAEMVQLPMDKIPSPFDGTIFATDKKTKLYTFSRTHTVKDNVSRVHRSYVDLEGKEIVNEKVVYKDNRLKEYDVKWFQTGEETWVRIENGKIKFKMKDRYGKVETSEEDTVANGLIGEQIGDYVYVNWDRLLQGDPLRIRLLIPRRRETIGFKLSKIDSQGSPGNMKLRVEMKPSTWVISLLVDPLVFEFQEKNGEKKLLNYFGRATPYVPKVKEKGWADLTGFTVFGPIKPGA